MFAAAFPAGISFNAGSGAGDPALCLAGGERAEWRQDPSRHRCGCGGTSLERRRGGWSCCGLIRRPCRTAAGCWSSTIRGTARTGRTPHVGTRTSVRSHGESGMTARLLPFTVDGLIWAASMVVLDASRRDQPVPRLAAWSLGTGIVATVGANLAHGVGHGPVGALISAWPALELVGSFELLMILIGARRDTRPSETEPEPQHQPALPLAHEAPLELSAVPTVEQIVRARHEAGHSQRAIARVLNIDRRRVKRMIDKWLDNARAIEASPVHLVRGYRSRALVSSYAVVETAQRPCDTPGTTPRNGRMVRQREAACTSCVSAASGPPHVAVQVTCAVWEARRPCRCGETNFTHTRDV